MDSFLPPLAIIYGVLAGMLLFSMVGRWIVALVAAVKAYRVDGKKGSGLSGPIATGLLHSGPWALAIAAYLSYYVLSQPHAAWWVWFFSGVGAAPVFVVLAFLGAARRRRMEESDTPLTPDALNLRRRHFVWGTTLFFGGGMSAVMIGGTWGTVHALGFSVFVIAVCLVGGYVFALVMWEWKKSLLQAQDFKRRRLIGGS
jgi:MFS family permease